jgi:hypothetical protein
MLRHKLAWSKRVMMRALRVLVQITLLILLLSVLSRILPSPVADHLARSIRQFVSQLNAIGLTPYVAACDAVIDTIYNVSASIEAAIVADQAGFWRAVGLWITRIVIPIVAIVYLRHLMNRYLPKEE